MAFFKFHKTGKAGPGGAADVAGGRVAARPRDDVQDLRVRARNRLIGAVALVVLAIIVFPLLFDTEQRPVVVDAPVVIAGTQPPVAMAEPVAPPPRADVPAPAELPETDAPGDPAESTAIAPDPGAGEDTDADGVVDGEEWVLGPEVSPLADADSDADASDAELEPSATRSKIRVTQAQEPARPATRPAAAGDRKSVV